MLHGTTVPLASTVLHVPKCVRAWSCTFESAKESEKSSMQLPPGSCACAGRALPSVSAPKTKAPSTDVLRNILQS
ncbi:hypothetical protein BE04_03510 [Sorangium cellulosum]|uniref:Uncharacterized protein n=1 Tax=Sorangium cellulosum TaxID=56 RepID=A0A150P1Y6_SORCE|nr:hypothetical protein BE04_03510 [Sorangium cellulosum]